MPGVKKKLAKKTTKTSKKSTKQKSVTKTAKVAPSPQAKSVLARLPSFSLAATGGATVTPKSLQGRIAVLYFYPKDATTGCTQQGHDFSRLKKSFTSAGAEVFGVSRDNLKSHEKFKEKEKYTIDLLSDEDESFCNSFGVIKMKNMYGKQVRGIERSTFVFDSQGKLLKEWRGVKVPGHAEEVLAFVQTLNED